MRLPRARSREVPQFYAVRVRREAGTSQHVPFARAERDLVAGREWIYAALTFTGRTDLGGSNVGRPRSSIPHE